jgi:hypothetical protein
MTALVPIQNLRSGTSNKRPTSTGLAVGQIAINYNEDDPAIYLRGHADALVKVSPTFVGSTAPNATPASGGASGNSKGETWLDTSTTPNALKIWNGSSWVASYALASGTTLVSPTLTGTTAAPTVAVGTNDTQIATTAFVNAEIANDAPTKTGGGASGTWGISVSGNAGTATALQTARTISLGGDLSGSASFDGTGNITITSTIGANSVALGTDTTGNYVAAGATSGNGISGSVSSEGGTFTVTSNATNANTGSTLVFRDASGNFSAGTISAALNGNASTATTLQTARTINGVSFNGSANITVEPYIEDDESTNATRYVVFTDDSSAGHKRLNEDSSLTYNPSTNTLTAGTFSGSLSGNATSATSATSATTAGKLTTARTISLGGDLSGSTSFDGSANVSISATIAANSVALGTDTTGNYVGAGATSGNGISGSVSSEGGTFTVTSNATNANTGSTIVFRDASGNFSAGTISAALNGNASTASTLATARTIALGGDLSGSASFNGGADITITATVADDSHAHIIGNVDGLQTALDAKAPLASPALTGTPTAPTASNGTNNTQIATTAFVQTTVAANAGLLGGSVTTTGSNKTLAVNEFCTVTSDGLTITLPASPAASATVGVSIGGSFTNTTIGRNGQNIMGLAENLTIDRANVSVLFKYVDATRGWRII